MENKMKISEILKFKTDKDLWFSEEKNSESKWFWDNKQICYHDNWKNGKWHDICKSWNSDGRLWIHQLYENGKMIKDFLEK